jgi:hypothetical protein
MHAPRNDRQTHILLQSQVESGRTYGQYRSNHVPKPAGPSWGDVAMIGTFLAMWLIFVGMVVHRYGL